MLSGIVGRMVEDQTLLKGRYDFNLDFAPDPPPGAQSDASSPGEAPVLFTAISEQLGLKLVGQKGLVDFVVVDSIERPSEN
jgi:uncharacterized protein (TIGR03435 family)